MRIGIRKTGYLASPYEGQELKSMSGKELNPVLMDIYKQGVSAHDRDIRNVIRYGTCKKAYNVDNKIKILKEDCKEVSEEKKVKNLKTEIQIMLELIEDSEVQLALTKLYNLNKHHGVPYLELFLEPYEQQPQLYFQLGTSCITLTALVLLRLQ